MNVFCTICEGEYYKGVITLLNNLINKGFRGCFYIGYKGHINKRIFRLKDKISQITSNIFVKVKRIEPGRHPAKQKPSLMKCAFEDNERAKYVFYADPDLLFKADWLSIEKWVNFGIALCEGVRSPVYDTHPLRKVWKQIARENGLEWIRLTDIYLNSGFVGLSKHDKKFLELWDKAIKISERYGELKDRFDRRELASLHPFTTWDQDALNIAVCCYKGEISIIGKEGMDFKHGGRWMSHATGASKPWNAWYIRRALRGKGPQQIDHLYWNHANSPFQAHSKHTILYAKLRIYLAQIIHRIL